MRLLVLDWTLAQLFIHNLMLSIQMTSYETLYGPRCQTPLCWTKLGEKKMLVQDTKGIVKLIRHRLRATL
ncbi:reverse transcriptase [Gossypium australe]|uniref:Reverse transcriptase n=1 Tax=Gossypium australe TaxID=47621 RepID=A0A5B6W6S2_9ROSI|nr:reverse transcriptase [Gossypium australe]